MTPLTAVQDATLEANEAAIDAAEKALAAGDIANLPALQATLDAAIAVQDAYIKTLVPVATPLTMGTVTPWTFTVGVTIKAIQLTATGGTGTGYVYTVDGLTPGLAIVGSQVTGTPTTAETNTMNFIVTDSAGNTNTGPAVTFITNPATVVTPPPPTGFVPFVNSGQLPAAEAALVSAMTLRCGVLFDSATIADVVNSVTGGQAFDVGWYGNPNANQNTTNMSASNVDFTAGGLLLSVDAANNTGGIVTSDPFSGAVGYLFKVNVPTLYQAAFIPSPGDWQEGPWWTTINDWLGETDGCERLDGGFAFHIHDNQGSIAPAGIGYSLNAGVRNTVAVLHLPSGMRYLIVNGEYLGSAQGWSDADMGSPQWMTVFGNSIGQGNPEVNSTYTVLESDVFQ